MKETRYAGALEKAQAALAEKNIPETQVSFGDIRVSFLSEKVFWFISGVKRKLNRRRGK